MPTWPRSLGFERAIKLQPIVGALAINWDFSADEKCDGQVARCATTIEQWHNRASVGS